MAEREESTRDVIIHLLDRLPFRPFEVLMSSGERYRIDEPRAVAVATSQLHYYPRSGLGIHLRLNQVASVEEPGESVSA
jgi:hypothetical protein